MQKKLNFIYFVKDNIFNSENNQQALDNIQNRFYLIFYVYVNPFPLKSKEYQIVNEIFLSKVTGLIS